MSIINKPNTFSPNTSISSSQVNSNFDTLYNDYNGSISAANLANNAVTTAKIADGSVTTAKLASGLVDSGWVATGGTHSVATGYNSGNRSFEIDTSTDLSGIVSPGMRYKVDRSVAPPDQCADLEASSSQYASKSSPTGITFTDDFTCEAWIKLESYTTSTIISRRTASTAGFDFRILSDGRLDLVGLSGGSNEAVRSYQSIPLNKWVHVAATADFSGNTGSLYVNGVSIPVDYQNSGSIASITQSGDLVVGAYTGGNTPFDGKLSDVRVWSDIRTETEIQDNMFAYPSDTTGLVAHFKLNGDFTDASTNGNDLTAQNSAVATDTDNPWNATEYGVITAVFSSTIQVFCPEGYGIPLETLTSPYYSTQDTPYGFPRDKGKWELVVPIKTTLSVTSTSFADQNMDLFLGIGSWDIHSQIYMRTGENTQTGTVVVKFTIGSSGTTETNPSLTTIFRQRDTSAATRSNGALVRAEDTVNITANTTFSLLASTNNASAPAVLDSSSGLSTIKATCAYI